MKRLLSLKNSLNLIGLLLLLVSSSCASFKNSCIVPCKLERKNLSVEESFSEKYANLNIKPRPHQLMPVHYLYTSPTQKGLLVNHFVGTGKTYLSLFFTELYKKEKVIIIAPSYLKSGWVDSLRNFPVKDIKRYEFLSYEEAPGKIIGRDLSKTLLIIDEAHNIIKYLTSPNRQIQSSYTDLYLNLQNAYKILALTATPIQNDESDLAYLLNLVMGEKVVPVNKERFRLHFTKVLKNRSFWRGHVSESLMVLNLSSLVGAAKILGWLSFVPPIIGITGVILPILNYVLYPIHEYKLRKFDPSRLEYYAGESVSFSGYTDSGGSKNYPTTSLTIKDVLYTREQHRLFFRFASKDLEAEELKLFFPNLNYSNKKFDVLSSTLLENYRYDLNAGLEIGNFSLKDEENNLKAPPKFLGIKKHLEKPLKKTVIYSLFSKKGIELFAKFLDENGLKGQYEMLSSKQTTEQQRGIISRYNKGENKILLLYPEIAEGVDLKGTRQVHFLEPIGNNSHFEQVKGRAIRYKSHTHLPEDERRVDVYVWKSMIDDTKSLLKGGSIKWLVGSSYRHEDFDKRFTELNYYSQYGAGKHQVDENYDFKYWSPDENATRRLETLKESSTNFYKMLSKNSIEAHYRKEEKTPQVRVEEIKRRYRKKKK